MGLGRKRLMGLDYCRLHLWLEAYARFAAGGLVQIAVEQQELDVSLK